MSRSKASERILFLVAFNVELGNGVDVGGTPFEEALFIGGQRRQGLSTFL